MKVIIHTSRLTAILFTSTLIPAISNAQGVLYDWTATCTANSTYSGQGTITIDSSDFTVSQMTGIIGGNTISSVYTGGGLTYNNVCNPTSPHLDSSGLAFLYHIDGLPIFFGLYNLNFVNGQYELNGVAYDNLIGQPFDGVKSPIVTLDTFSITLVPEPTTIVLTAITGLVLVGRKKLYH